MYCKFCGATLKEGDKFCLSCGAVASASDEKVEPKAAKSEFTHDKRDPREVFAMKGENYYNYNNTFLQNDKYDPDIYIKQSRNKHLSDPIMYTENIGGKMPEHMQNAVNQQKKSKKTGLIVFSTIFILAVIVAIVCLVLILK